MRCANSPVKESCEGAVQWSPGSRLSMLVSHWLSFFQLRFTPHSVLFSGSLPIDTLVVSACSDKCWKVPLNWKSFEKSYSQFMPYMVFRCCP